MKDKQKELFIGKKIKDIYVDGYCVEVLIEDGTKLEYNATDGGWSSWEITKCKEFLEGE